MSLRRFILFIVIGTLLAWAAWAVTIVNVDPREAGIPELLLFYVTLGIALTGTAALVLSSFRLFLLRKKDIPSREIRVAFRHALLFAVVAVGSLMLASKGLFRAWHVLALIAVATLIESFLATSAHRVR